MLICEPGEESFSSQMILKKEIFFNSENTVLNINIPIDSMEFSFNSTTINNSENEVIIKVEKIMKNKIINTYCTYNYFVKTKNSYSGLLYYIDKGQYLLSYYDKKRCDENLRKAIGYNLGDLYGWSVRTLGQEAYDKAQKKRLV